MSELKGQRGEGWRRQGTARRRRAKKGRRIKDLDYGVECNENEEEEEKM